MLHVSRASSFISTKFFVLNLDGWYFYCLTNLLFFDIPLLYFYINPRSTIIFCLSSGDIYLSLDISLLCSFVTVSELFCREFFWDFCNFISDFINNQITSCFCCFLNHSFWSSFECICCRLLSMIKRFCSVFTTKIFTYIFTDIFTHIFSKI